MKKRFKTSTITVPIIEVPRPIKIVNSIKPPLSYRFFCFRNTLLQFGTDYSGGIVESTTYPDFLVLVQPTTLVKKRITLKRFRLARIAFSASLSSPDGSKPSKALRIALRALKCTYCFVFGSSHRLGLVSGGGVWGL
ncbi:MAG: hypothetical protein ACK42D_04420, partial [Candidatus Paceibacteria bacterium]